MRIRIRHDLELDLSGRLLGHFAGPPPLPDAPAALAEALDHPFGYPALRRALTPGDHVVILLDEAMPGVAGLLVALLDHVASAGVEPGAVTVLCPTTTDQPWLDELPERHEEIRVEVHDSKDRRRLSYLATTGGGRRLYINRAAVDADQLVVLTERRYDLQLGYGGGEGAIFPALADEPTLKDAATVVRTEVPGEEPWPLMQEAIEVSWLLGQPFYVQAIAAQSGGVGRVITGASDATRAARQLLDEGWRPRLPRRAGCVIASLSGPGLTFADLAWAAAAAARIVEPQGRVVLIADVEPDLGPGGVVLFDASEPQSAAATLEQAAVPGSSAARLWAQSAAHARLSILGTWPDETAEELFATPLAGPAQVQRLAESGGEVVVLQDAHRMMPVVE